MQLSILICHLYDRRESLKRLHRCIVDQCVDVDCRIDYEHAFAAFVQNEGCQFKNGIQVLVDGDNRELSTGEKRNNLLARSTGRYVSMADDDDLLDPQYCEKVLEAIKFEPDVVGITGILKRRGCENRKFIHSLAIPHWFENGGVYFRNNNHLNPVKRDLAIKAGYPDKVLSEDHQYAKNLAPLLKTEFFISKPLYFYLKDN